MPPKNNENITAYFQSTGEAKGKSKAVTLSTKMSHSETSTKEPVPEPQTKGKGKRPASASPPAPAAKRPDTDTAQKTRNHLAYNDLPSDWLQAPNTSEEPEDASPKSLELSYHKGDIFVAPPHTLLIHACNTQGHWGAGIAKAFKTLYPKAYTAHHNFCAKQHNPKTRPVPTGTAQLLAPVDSGTDHWIGCVFTSAKYGKAKDKPDVIVKNTAASMRMLLELVRIAGGEGDGVKQIRMCKINSGKFGVPWEKTEEVLKGIVLREGWMGRIEVWEPSED